MQRRTFLKTTALASAALAGDSDRAMSREKSASPIRCGLLGLGHGHAGDALKVLQGLPEYEVVGVCEPDEATYAASTKHPAVQRAARVSREALLDDPSVRMLAIESDVPRLLGFAREAIDAGKHIHLDKPAGSSYPEFKALMEDAEKRSLLVQMGYMFRYNPGFDLIRKAVREGWLGDVYSIQASMCTDHGPEKRIETAHHPGGTMLNLGCHLIDMIVLILGEPEKVTPFLRHDGDFDDTFSDNTLAVLEFPKAMAMVETTAMEPRPFPARRFKIVGTEGSIILSPLEPPRVRLALESDRGGYRKGVQEFDLPDLDRHILDLQDLARCIRGEAEISYSKSHDLAVQRTVLRACGETI